MGPELDAAALTGYSLAEARSRLQAAGLAVTDETEVCPPGDFVGEGEIRVVKVASVISGAHIYYAHRTYRRRRDEKTE